MFRKGLTLKEIFLKNISGTELKINLWENAIQLIDNVITCAMSVPVLVLSSLTVGSYNDQYFLNSTSATQIYVNLEIPEVLALQNRKKYFNATKGHHQLNGQVFTCEAIIYDIVHDYAPFYKSCTKISCRKKVIDKGDHYWCNNCNNTIPSPDARYQLKARIQDDTKSTLITIFGDEAEELLKHPASELEKLIESVTESSQILNNTFQSYPPDNMHKNDSTLMKKKQLGLPRSIDIPQSSNKNSNSKKPYKRTLCGKIPIWDQSSRIRIEIVTLFRRREIYVLDVRNCNPWAEWIALQNLLTMAIIVFQVTKLLFAGKGFMSTSCMVQFILSGKFSADCCCRDEKLPWPELTEALKCIRSLDISKALEMQIEVQRRLNEHLQVIV
ncbi:hypothetical protein IFM89_004140 [Coptis chinensis]|uniref:Replication factor A C-terminal domain-containing protein n=1 Tax=Coptis chinensis TaxID=261450 RepID=A0A835LGC4_9MAGN|nr:hypothetical protein IFM89_004140 [Coptis chinensis]